MRATPFSYLFCLFIFWGCTLSKSVIAQETPADFIWPEGKKAGVSLSFDDARLSNVDVGLPLFKKHGAQVTYYVVPNSMKPRLEGWKQAVKDGHEIGNHTIHHPCSGNFSWARDKALENYTLDQMRKELLTANQEIENMLGVNPTSFAYSCGQTFVGRGTNTKSYVPLVAELFTSGRGWLNESTNDPDFVDFAQIKGVESDGKDFEKDILPLIQEAKNNGTWLVLAGHEIGTGGRQTTLVSMLEQLLQYVNDPKNEIWLAPVGTIADYVSQQRTANRKQQLQESLVFCSTFDNGFDADFSNGDQKIYTAPAYDKRDQAKPGMTVPDIQMVKGNGLHGGNALQFKKKTKEVIFYQSAKNISYSETNWEGTISLWLKLNPEADLAPGYTDPIQITDVGYNDAAFWVDFSNKNPRDFRMGVYGDLAVWNPDNIPPDDNPAFQNRLLPAKDRPFSRAEWTHVLFTFSGLNTPDGAARFYMDGKYQGTRHITEPFTWDLPKSKIFVGLNYVGMLDEIAIFDKALSKEEVELFYQLPKGAKELFKN